MKVIFMGSPDFAVASLNYLLNSKHKVELVVTQPDKPAGRGQKVTPCAVAAFAAENGLNVVQPVTLKNNAALLEQFRKISPDAIVVVAYGKLIPKEMLDIPAKGCVNVHPSLLPKYRGSAPINRAIMNGEHMTGVTTMFMNEKMDEGDILLQAGCEIMPHDTAETLHEHLAVVGAELLVKTLDRLEAGTLAGIRQDHSQATTFFKLTKEDGAIDWKKSAQEIYNMIRGLQPWPRAYTHIAGGGGKKGEEGEVGETMIIYDAAPVDIESDKFPGTIVSLDKAIMVATGKGQLCLLEIQLPGKKRMPVVEYLKGGKLKVGDKFV